MTIGKKQLIVLIVIYLLMIFLVACSTSDDKRSVGLQPVGGDNLVSVKISVVNRPCPSTIIDFEIIEATNVKLDVLTATGYVVRVLIDDRVEAGIMNIEWDHTNESGIEVEAGIYLLRLKAGSYEAVKVLPYCATEEDCAELHDE